MTRPAALLVSCVACISLVSCGSKPPTTPSTPATVTALTISAPPASMKAGDTFQLTATATLSNGRTATSGFTVNWSSSDTNVATVNGNGLVTAKSDGRATISASSSAIASSVEFLIRGGRTLTGIVTETAPTTSVMVAGARVTVADGLYAGISATTDASGAFTLEDVNGVVNLQISALHFDEARVTADTTAASPLTVRLLPAARTVTSFKEFWVPWGDRNQRFQSTMTFGMHRPGRVELFTSGSVGSGESSPLCSELRDEDNKLLWEVKTVWLAPAQTALSLAGGRSYTLKVSDCGWAGRPILNGSRLTAVHPY